MKPVTRTFDEGELWSFLRMVMAKGANIGVDYVNGTLTYEQHSAHLDAEAAHFAKQLIAASPPAGDTPGAESEVVKDAARYRWLRLSRSLEVNAPDANEDGGTDVYYTLHGEALDARIDEELELNKSLKADVEYDAALSGASGTTRGDK